MSFSYVKGLSSLPRVKLLKRYKALSGPPENSKKYVRAVCLPKETHPSIDKYFSSYSSPSRTELSSPRGAKRILFISVFTEINIDAEI